MGDTGTPGNLVSSCNTNDLQPSEIEGAAESGASLLPAIECDLELAQVVDSWEILPPEVRTAIAILVRSIDGSSNNEEPRDAS